MNNKLPNCTAAGSSTQRLKEGGSMVTRSFSSHLSVHNMCTYIIRVSVHNHYTGAVCAQVAETQRRGSDAVTQEVFTRI